MEMFKILDRVWNPIRTTFRPVVMALGLRRALLRRAAEYRHMARGLAAYLPEKADQLHAIAARLEADAR